MLKKDALSSPIVVRERVDHIRIAIQLDDIAYQVFAVWVGRII